MDARIILILLLGLILVLGGVVVVLLITQPRARRPADRARSYDAQVPGTAGYLAAVSGPLAGQTFALRPPPRGLVIGRSPDSDIVVDATTVSRHHAQVMVEGDQVVLYDRDSTNGTWLPDGRRISRYVLSMGDQFQIGDSIFAYARLGQPLPSPQPPPARAPAPLQLQTYFEGYLLLDVLGYGGMSVVYRARSPDGAQVAIKILDAADEWIARKFIQEGNIGSALCGHPNIRVVHDLRYSQDRRPFLVMEYIEGASLRKLLGARLPIAQIVHIVGQACDALDFAHQRRIVHRDIKPENILVTPECVVKVTDFGVAKLTSAVTVTSDRIVGTPEYISPEQAKGEEVRPASDIYSLGVVLYELLTGQVPFPLPDVGETQDQRSAAYTVIRQHIHAAPAPPGRLNPDLVASPLEKVTLKALDKDPSKRYERASDLARALGYQPGQAAIAAVEPGGAYLRILEGPRSGQTISIPQASQRLALGRALLDPADTKISRQHAVVMRRGGEWWIQDTSMNGTWVNGQRIYGEAPLTGERLIEIAGHRLQLQI